MQETEYDPSLDPHGGTREQSEPRPWDQVGYEHPLRVGVFASALRHPLLVILPILVLGAAAAVLASQLSTTYTAASRLQVGRLQVSAPGAVGGFASASQALAAGYSRAITADGVVDPVARRLDRPAADVRNRLFASPIPDSPLFRVEATGQSSRDAVALANAGASALVDYIAKVNRSNPDARRLYGQYQASSVASNSANIARDTARRRYRDAPTGPNRRAYAQASALAQTLRLRAGAIA